MDVRDIARQLGGVSAKAVDRALEFSRMAKLKAAGGWPASATCVNACCIELAIKKCGESFDRAKLIRLSLTDDKPYIATIAAVQNVLGIGLPLTIRELCVQFGCMNIQSFADHLLQQFKTRYLKTLPEYRRATTRFTKPVFIIVAMLLSARIKKAKLEKKALIEQCGGCTENEFTLVADSFYVHCEDLIGKKKPPPVRKPKVPKPAGDDDEGVSETGAPPASDDADERQILADAAAGLDAKEFDLADVETNPELRQSATIAAAREHEEWRETLIASFKADELTATAAPTNKASGSSSSSAAAAATPAIESKSKPPAAAATAGADSGAAAAAAAKRKHPSDDTTAAPPTSTAVAAAPTSASSSSSSASSSSNAGAGGAGIRRYFGAGDRAKATAAEERERAERADLETVRRLLKRAKPTPSAPVAATVPAPATAATAAAPVAATTSAASTPARA